MVLLPVHRLIIYHGAVEPHGHPKKQAPKKRASNDVPNLHAKIAELEKEIARLKDIAGRAQADLQNAKARVERERGEIGRFAAEEIVRKLLPTLDNFQRAFQHVPKELQGNEWVSGVQVVEQELIRHMEAVGLQRLQSQGAIVDPHYHEVLNVGPGEEGRVIEVYEEGFLLHGKVIRPAKVKAGGGMSVHEATH